MKISSAGEVLCPFWALAVYPCPAAISRSKNNAVIRLHKAIMSISYSVNWIGWMAECKTHNTQSSSTAAIAELTKPSKGPMI
jgi:hypothetical protein